jgi:hypothetical protein
LLPVTAWTRALAVAGFAVTIGHAQRPAPTAPVVLPVHVARMYPVANRAAWDAVLSVIKQKGIRTSTVDRAEQFLITRDIPVDVEHFGFDVHASIGSGFSRAYAQVHIFVPPTAEPARIYVGSRIDAVLGDGAAIGPSRIRSYNRILIGNWWQEALGSLLGSDGFPIPVEFGPRAELARSLPPGQPTTCLARLLARELNVTAPTEPVLVHQQRFEVAAGRRRLPTVAIDASVFEDGFVWPTRIVSGASESDPFGAAAAAGLMLSRYRPAQAEHCGVPVSSRFTMKFSD